MGRTRQEAVTTFAEVIQSSDNQKIMIHRFTENASRIFLACGPTDFRKQIPGLIATVTLQFDLDPYNGSYVL